MQRKLSSIRVGNRFRTELGDIDGLKASIQELGLLQPIVVRPDGYLIAGLRRLAALRELGWEEVPTVTADNLETALTQLKAERDENVCHKAFTPEEALRAAQAIAPLEQAAARERQGARTDLQPSAKFAEGNAEKHTASAKQSRAKVAAAVGLSHPTLERIEAVVKAAEQEPEKYEHLKKKMNESGKVNGVYKQLVIAQKAEAIAKEPPPLPTGPFRVIVIDPPWQYYNRAEDASHRASNPYPTMSVDEISALPVAKMAHPDGAVLWLWTTNALLHDAFHILQAWGFEHKTVLTWVKNKMGTGDWLRGQTEHCLLAVHGKSTVQLGNQTTVLYGPLREHSRKPDEFYVLVETLCPGSKVELFARTPRSGWVCHGDEVMDA